MDIDRDTFLTTVYVHVDTVCQRHPQPPRRGRPQLMSDSEVLTLALVGHWRGTSERALLRWAQDQLPAYFPHLLSQSAFNRRQRALAGQLITLLQDLALALGQAQDPYEVVDALAIPLAQRCRGQRHACFTPEEASLGRGGVGKAYYFGVSLVLSVAASGPITGLVITPAHVQERWGISALLSWRSDPTAVPQTAAALATRNPWHKVYVGPTGYLLGPATVGVPLTGHYLADRGFSGQVWQAHWHEDLHATVWTPDQLRGPVRQRFHRARQVIETVNGQLTEVLHIRFPRARTHAGVVTRIVAACSAFNLGMLLNRQYERPDFALATLFAG